MPRHWLGRDSGELSVIGVVIDAVALPNRCLVTESITAALGNKIYEILVDAGNSTVVMDFTLSERHLVMVDDGKKFTVNTATRMKSSIIIRQGS